MILVIIIANTLQYNFMSNTYEGLDSHLTIDIKNVLKKYFFVHICSVYLV